jgi:hypothetical protein
VLTPESPDSLHSISKSPGVRADGSCVSVTYHDVLHRGPTAAHRPPLGVRTLSDPHTGPAKRSPGVCAPPAGTYRTIQIQAGAHAITAADPRSMTLSP